MNVRKELLSSCAFISLLAVACTVSFIHMRQALSGLETPAATDIIQGKWPKQFEKAFREALPVDTLSRDLWGRLEYKLFHEGRRGVVVGTDGWLYTDEEFSCPEHYEQKLADNLSFVAGVEKQLAQKNTKLVVVLVPAKSRILPDHLGEITLPQCRTALYKNIYSFLVANNIPVTDLLPDMISSALHENMYLKTDTHWSPAGAKLAAQAAAGMVHEAFKDISLPQSIFVSQAGGKKSVTGDLTSYVPGVNFPPNQITSYMSGTAVASAEAGQGLFDDAVPQVALVGTSYSANPNWNFEGFLKEALKTDVLNMSDQGLGPFVVMDKYLQNDAWKNTPPQLVVWEMPERYLLMPHGVSNP